MLIPLTPVRSTCGSREVVGFPSSPTASEGGHRCIPPVETKDVLVEVMRQVLRIHSRVDSQEPGLRIAKGAVNVTHYLSPGRFVPVSRQGRLGVAPPAVCFDGCPSLDVLGQKGERGQPIARAGFQPRNEPCYGLTLFRFWRRGRGRGRWRECIRPASPCQECSSIQSRKPVGRRIGMPKGFSRINRSRS